MTSETDGDSLDNDLKDSPQGGFPAPGLVDLGHHRLAGLRVRASNR